MAAAAKSDWVFYKICWWAGGERGRNVVINMSNMSG